MRLLVSRDVDDVVHTSFRELPQFLEPGDLLVVNTSATFPAALRATRADGSTLGLHLSTPAKGRDPDRFWNVELRSGDGPFGAPEVGERLALPAGRVRDDPGPALRCPPLARSPGASASTG